MAKTGKSTATIHNVAEACGVSARTVSRVMNGQAHVRPALRERILETAQAMGYRPDPSARALKSGRKRIIGIVVNAVSSDTTFKRIEHISKLCSAWEHAVLVRFAENSEMEESTVESLMPWCDGMVIFSNLRTVRSPVLDSLTENGFPFMLVDPPHPVPYPAVRIDRARGYREAAEYLIGKGRKKPVLLVEHFRSGDRIRGFKKGLQSAGIPFSDDMIFSTGKEYAGGRNAAPELIRAIRKKKADAVICHNDKMVLGLMNAFIREGIHVPKDAALIGYDDDSFTPYTSPAITTIAQLGGNPADFIFEQIRDNIENGTAMKSKTLRTGLIIRESA
ncbi:LacI family DNA-binding transcriptional regulator [Breznakiella homolactica]|uniref:LacI family DNA-binding transcriptional regulator n=1 Tax=Breznakiella homolactica TaxID=2798577 RepID=A0A7T7XP56_9SPIR|nr:LacI family DNA-binding transcriptional regulator [Breznakiella homolactica]QQO09940.1 LacI family transcriptional regulator [Breznakiella homolactica]